VKGREDDRSSGAAATPCRGPGIPSALHFRKPVEHAPAAAGRFAAAPCTAAETRSRRRATRGDRPARALRCRWRRLAPSRAPGTPGPRYRGVQSCESVRRSRAAAAGPRAGPRRSIVHLDPPARSPV